MKKQRVLVLCRGNSSRSQMAEGWLKYYSGNSAEIWSAGIEAKGVNKFAVRSMRDAVLDISDQKSKTLEDLPDISFDYVITLCDETKSKYHGLKECGEHIHKSFPDPDEVTGTEEEIMMAFNKIRDKIEDFVFDFVHTNIRPLIPDNFKDVF